MHQPWHFEFFSGLQQYWKIGRDVECLASYGRHPIGSLSSPRCLFPWQDHSRGLHFYPPHKRGDPYLFPRTYQHQCSCATCGRIRFTAASNVATISEFSLGFGANMLTNLTFLLSVGPASTKQFAVMWQDLRRRIRPLETVCLLPPWSVRDWLADGFLCRAVRQAVSSSCGALLGKACEFITYDDGG